MPEHDIYVILIPLFSALLIVLTILCLLLSMYKCYICRQKYLLRKIHVSPNIEV